MRPLILCLLLAGCASEPQKIPMPVTVGCVGKEPARPVNSFGAGIYPGDKAAAQAALIDASAWEGYALKLEVIIAGCPKASAEPAPSVSATARLPK